MSACSRGARAWTTILPIAVALVSMLVPAAPAHALAPSTGATPTKGKPWPRGATLRIYAKLGAAFEPSLQAAVGQYNASGARLRLVRTNNRRAAHIVIIRHEAQSDVARTPQGRPARGQAVMRFRLRHLASQQRRYVAAYLFTHELGHVLGLAEQPRYVCTVMSEYTFAGRCEYVDARATPLSPAIWTCRILQVTDQRALVRLYGGRVAPAGPAACSEATGVPLQALSAPANVAVVASTTPGEIATITWAPTPSTQRVQVIRYTRSCASVVRLDATETLISWTGTGAPERGSPEAYVDGSLGSLVDRAPVLTEDQTPAPPGPRCYELRSYSTVDGARAEPVFVELAG